MRAELEGAAGSPLRIVTYSAEPSRAKITGTVFTLHRIDLPVPVPVMSYFWCPVHVLSPD